MIDILSGLYPLKGAKDYNELTVLAQQENHVILAPTHVIKKGGRIVGHVSVGGIPMTFCHFSNEYMDASDSFGIINTVENMLQLGGHMGVVTPISKDSPFHKVMSHSKIGYKSLGTVELFYKEF